MSKQVKFKTMDYFDMRMSNLEIENSDRSHRQIKPNPIKPRVKRERKKRKIFTDMPDNLKVVQDGSPKHLYIERRKLPSGNISWSYVIAVPETKRKKVTIKQGHEFDKQLKDCLLYTSPSPRDRG